ncbi:MAG TPA: CBS domain-containing protein [Thermoanaerobaculia bacterium]|nr:CBS domain-containing protein [Thermoanaerobaculia bacterium]
MSLEAQLARAFLEEHPREAARALERMPAGERAAVVRAAPAEAGAALGEMVAPAAAECLAMLSPDEAAPALDRLEPDHAIALLRRMPADAAERLVTGLPDDRQERLRRVLRYPEGTAGALMDPMVLALPDDVSVAEARVRLRREARGLLYYLYVVDRQGVLAGVLDIAELMRARAREPIGSVMNTPVEHLPAWTPAAGVRVHPAWRSFHALPVTDEAGRLAGAIRYQTLRRLEQEADAGGGAAPTGLTVGALGELFHLGLAGFVEGVAGAAAPRAPRPADDEGAGR